MPLFQYVALDHIGKSVNGLIDADSLDAAKERLRLKEIIVTKIDIAKSQKQVSLDTTTLIHFTRDLTNLLSSQLPLYECLLTLEEKYRTHKCHFLFLDLCDLVKQGKSLSLALKNYPNSFDNVYIAMVEAGENSGGLDRSFQQLYKIISRSEKFRKQLRSALAYPIFLLAFCFAVMMGLFLFLIPSMGELLEGRDLQPLTQMVLSISKGLTKNWPYLLTGLISFGMGAFFVLRMHKVKNYLKCIVIKIPILKTIVIEKIIMRFCRVLAVLLSSGVPIVEALMLAKSVMNNPLFEEAIQNAIDGLVSGKKLSEELRRSNLFPPMVVRMIATAEEGGNTATMLENIATIYEEMLEKTLTQFTNLLQPAMLMVLGVLVGVTILAVLLPLTDVSGIT